MAHVLFGPKWPIFSTGRGSVQAGAKRLRNHLKLMYNMVSSEFGPYLAGTCRERAWHMSFWALNGRFLNIKQSVPFTDPMVTNVCDIGLGIEGSTSVANAFFLHLLSLLKAPQGSKSKINAPFKVLT